MLWNLPHPTHHSSHPQPPPGTTFLSAIQTTSFFLQTAVEAGSLVFCVFTVVPEKPLTILLHKSHCVIPLRCLCVPAKSFQSCATLRNPVDHSPPRLLWAWDSPGKNAGVGYHALLQRIFPTQGSNPLLLHWQVSSLPLVPPGKPRDAWAQANSWLRSPKGQKGSCLLG